MLWPATAPGTHSRTGDRLGPAPGHGMWPIRAGNVADKSMMLASLAIAGDYPLRGTAIWKSQHQTMIGLPGGGRASPRGRPMAMPYR